MKPGTSISGIALLIASGITSASVSLFAALLSREGVVGWVQLAARLVLCVPALLVYLLFHSPGAIRPRGRRDLRASMLNGALLLASFAPYTYSIYLGTSPTKAILPSHLSPIYVALGGAALLGEKLTWKKLAALVIGLVGLAMILKLWDGTPVAGSGLGDWLTGFSGLMFAATVLYGRWNGTGRRMNPVAFTFWSLVFALAWLVAIGLVVRPWTDPSFLVPGLAGSDGLRLVGYALGLALPGTALAYVFLYTGLERMEAGPASILRLSVPVSVFILSVIFLGEPAHWWQVTGGAVILSAGALVAI